MSKLKVLGLAILAVAVLAVHYKLYRLGHMEYLRYNCDRSIISELHWEWRLRTKEVQSNKEVKAITADMYKKSVQHRVKQCTKLWSEKL